MKTPEQYEQEIADLEEIIEGKNHHILICEEALRQEGWEIEVLSDGEYLMYNSKELVSDNDVEIYH